MTERFSFTPFWKLTRWGFLFRKHEDALRVHRGCDEWHNPSRFLIVPLVGEFIAWRIIYDRGGPEHLWAHGPEGWSGENVDGCAICDELRAEFEA